MANTSLQRRLDAAVDVWQREFGGKERASRDLQLLDRILGEVRGVMGTLERRLGPLRADERALFQAAREWIGLFTKERAAILVEKALPERTPERRWISEPAGRANVWLALLRSRFHVDAKVVDLALVHETLEGLQVSERDMVARTPEIPEPWMLENLVDVRASVAGVAAQEAELAKAMTTGSTTARRDFLVPLGRDLEVLLAWEAKFIARKAQRPHRLRHAAATSRMLVERIRAAGGLTGAEGDLVGQLDARAESLEAQLESLITERMAGPDETIAALDAELGSIARVYKQNFANKLRTEVDLALLRRVLYRASSVALQASELARDVPGDKTEAFRARSRERQAIYEREEQAVAEKQAARPRR